MRKFLFGVFLVSVLFCCVLGASDEDDGTPTRDLMKLNMGFEEERVKAHFRIPKDAKLPVEPERVTNISREKFKEYALRGQPVIITDGMRDWLGNGLWNCRYFHDQFPEEEVGGFTAYKADALKWRKKLGDPWFETRELLGIPKDEEDPKNPHIMSWYYSGIGISGTRGHDVKRNETVLQMIKSGFQTPYFLEPTKINNDTVMGRLEFFFGTEGAGVHPHTDPVCQWIFSGQMSGRKSWRLSLPYNIELLEKSNPGYKFRPSDGNALLAAMMNKASIYEFTLNPGELMFFPPGMIHTTRATGKECSTSVSLQFAEPNPIMYLKEFFNYLISDVVGASSCYPDHFNWWLFGAPIPNQDGTPASNAAFANMQFPKMDSDANGVISVEEARLFFEVNRDDSAGGLVADDPMLDANSFIEAHDTNNDKLVSKMEFDSVVYSMWTPRMAQIAVQLNRPRPVSYFFGSDRNSDDYVTEDELREAYPHVKWQDLLKYDDDKDGRLFQGEFHKHLGPLYSLFLGRPLTAEELETEGLSGDGADEDDDEEEDAIPGVTKPRIVRDVPPPPAAGIKGIKITLDETQVRDLWKVPLTAGSLPVAPLRVSDLTQNSFLEYARRGQPLIVTDGLKGMKASSDWTCNYFKEHHAKDSILRCKGCNWTTLGQMDASSERSFWEFLALGQNTQIGGEQPVRDAKTVEELRAATTIPYFVPPSQVNKLLHDDALNVYFGTHKGFMAPSSEMSCFWSFFGQVRGSSFWKLTLPYSVRQLQQDNADYTYTPADGKDLIDRMITEHPVLQFTLKEGESLVIPPGLLKNIIIESSGCAVLFRTNFMDPAPTTYLKTFHERFMSDSDGASGCFTDHYNRWLFGSILPKSDGKPESNLATAAEVFKSMDTNNDGSVTVQEAEVAFPGVVDSGAIRTAENDGKSFIQANELDGNGVVTLPELEATYRSLWNPVIRLVSNLWYYVDQRNAQEDGNWDKYGLYVDSIRFPYGKDLSEVVVEFGDNGEEKKKSGPEPQRQPKSVEAISSIPVDFPLVTETPAPGVFVARPRSGTGVGFILWHNGRRGFIGHFVNGKRRGSGVYCCKDGDLFDQDWQADEDSDISVQEPPLDVEVKKRFNAEIVHSESTMWLGYPSLEGQILYRWSNGDIFIGTMKYGKRIGKGIFLRDNKVVEAQNWEMGEDKTAWRDLLELD